MDRSLSNVTTMPGREVTGSRVRILRVSSPREPEDGVDDACVFVTIGAGETHVSVLDDEGRCQQRWTAIFGWSYLFGIPLLLSGSPVLLEEAESVARALRGRARIYGQDTDTSPWVAEAGKRLEAALEDILRQTIGSGAHFTAIILCAPMWLHGLLSGCRSLRPHIVQEIRES